MKKIRNEILQPAPLKSRLRGLYINNFQSITEPIYIEFNGITLFYGPNSAGKSAIVDALKLLRLCVDAEKSNFNNEHLWNTRANCDTSLGIEFIAENLRDGYDSAVDRWLEKEMLYSRPHVELMEYISGKIIQIEYSASRAEFKFAIEGTPIFEFSSFPATEFNEDLSAASTEEEIEDADMSDRYFYGHLVVHKNSISEKLPFDAFHSLIRRLDKDYGVITSYMEEGDVWRYIDSPATKLYISQCDDRVEIRGIDLEMFRGEYSRINVKVGLGVEKSLRPRGLDKDNIENTIRRKLFEEIEEIAVEFNLIVAGLAFQMKEVLSYSHVSGDRRTIQLKNPVYVSEDLEGLVNVNLENIHQSLGEYAKSVAMQSRRAKNSGLVKNDLVAYSFKHILKSLSGYSIKASALKVKELTKNRKTISFQGLREGLIVRLMVDTPSGLRLGLDDVGSGISYILPILTALWTSEISFIEQPELHLHPAAQCEMGDVFIAAMSQGKSCIVESHSEHLLLRILRRIRETTSGSVESAALAVRNQQISVYYFRPDGAGSTKVIRMRIDRNGELLTEWPGGFFEERDKELFHE